MSKPVDVTFLFNDIRSIFDLIFGLFYLSVVEKKKKREKEKKPFQRWFESVYNSVGRREII